MNLDWTVRDSTLFDRSGLYNQLHTVHLVLKILRHTFVYLLSGWPYWNTSQWNVYEIYPSLLKSL